MNQTALIVQESGGSGKWLFRCPGCADREASARLRAAYPDHIICGECGHPMILKRDATAGRSFSCGKCRAAYFVRLEHRHICPECGVQAPLGSKQPDNRFVVVDGRREWRCRKHRATHKAGE